MNHDNKWHLGEGVYVEYWGRSIILTRSEATGELHQMRLSSAQIKALLDFLVERE